MGQYFFPASIVFYSNIYYLFKSFDNNDYKSILAAPVRFELTHAGVRVQSLTAWLWGNVIIISKKIKKVNNYSLNRHFS